VGSGPSYCPYSPKCLEDEFSEVAHRKMPIRTITTPRTIETTPKMINKAKKTASQLNTRARIQKSKRSALLSSLIHAGVANNQAPKRLLDARKLDHLTIHPPHVLSSLADKSRGRWACRLAPNSGGESGIAGGQDCGIAATLQGPLGAKREITPPRTDPTTPSCSNHLMLFTQVPRRGVLRSSRVGIIPSHDVRDSFVRPRRRDNRCQCRRSTRLDKRPEAAYYAAGNVSCGVA
jgi:hypothetical protein